MSEAERAQKKEERFRRADKNGDGFLTRDEVGDKRWERLKARDANGDQKISLHEMKQFHQTRKGQHKGKHGNRS